MQPQPSIHDVLRNDLFGQFQTWRDETGSKGVVLLWGDLVEVADVEREEIVVEMSAEAVKRADRYSSSKTVPLHRWHARRVLQVRRPEPSRIIQPGATPIDPRVIAEAKSRG